MHRELTFKHSAAEPMSNSLAAAPLPVIGPRFPFTPLPTHRDDRQAAAKFLHPGRGRHLSCRCHPEHCVRGGQAKSETEPQEPSWSAEAGCPAVVARRARAQDRHCSGSSDRTPGGDGGQSRGYDSRLRVEEDEHRRGIVSCR
jgi:hypothetical protein